MENKIIVKVWRNKGNNQLLVTIPAKSGIQEGEYVEINPLENKNE